MAEIPSELSGHCGAGQALPRRHHRDPACFLPKQRDFIKKSTEVRVKPGGRSQNKYI